MTNDLVERRRMTVEEWEAGLAEIRAHLACARRHAERMRLLQEERERLERLYFGRRFILIRF